MIQHIRKTRTLGAALTVLLAAGLTGFSGLVFCIGADGHRALEIEHAGIACPAQGGVGDGAGDSLQQPAPADCLDLPAAVGGPVVPAPSATDLLLAPASFADLPEPAPRREVRLTAAMDARAGPSPLALHLVSTVLLV